MRKAFARGGVRARRAARISQKMIWIRVNTKCEFAPGRKTTPRPGGPGRGAEGRRSIRLGRGALLRRPPQLAAEFAQLAAQLGQLALQLAHPVAGRGVAEPAAAAKAAKPWATRPAAESRAARAAWAE